jgi:hypothetical protein
MRLLLSTRLPTIPLDFTHRFTTANGHWFKPDRSGSLFFLPIWFFGLNWFVLGVVYTIVGR